ncbi:copper transport protein ATOX1-like [Paramacrobiotus metropolitanus]|uniref:copper transport protein ATOX1-like n=1 Tax=Paramacrobiotus metropolitanus TaxID=2943436 RepID=UPI002445A5F4|nr:copper transport protein ATOX1-like [Paramacrobiotus metropolitanus]
MVRKCSRFLSWFYPGNEVVCFFFQFILTDSLFPTMAAQTHEFFVDMTCEGCSGAVTRILDKQKGNGVNSFQIDLPNKKVFIDSSLTPDELLATLQKSKKEVKYVGLK